MDIKELYNSLSPDEKAELMSLLERDEYKSNLIPYWIEAHHDQLTERVRIVLTEMYNNEDSNLISEVKKSIFLRHRNTGIKTWDHFVAVRDIDKRTALHS